MRNKLFQSILLLSTIFFGSSCKKGNGTNQPPEAPVQPVLLKEINLPHLIFI